MKKTLYIFFLIISIFSYSQSGPNRFDESENDNVFNRNTNVNDHTSQEGHETALDTGGGNPGDPLPIDNYIPFLAITAVGIIVYTAQKKKKLLS